MFYRIYSKKRKEKENICYFLSISTKGKFSMLAKCIISVIDLYNICSRLLRQTTVLTKYSSAPVGVRITKKVGNHCSTG